ncbi:hypothetical protein [Salmonella phage SSBI34]|nr:hypothetical protein [Salmonella phage SSBI34]
MKKLIIALLCSVLLTGCLEEGEDKYKNSHTILPSRIQELYKVCETQPGYQRGRVIVRKSEPKGVLCYFRDNTGYMYTLDAGLIELKIKEGLR